MNKKILKCQILCGQISLPILRRQNLLQTLAVKFLQSVGVGWCGWKCVEVMPFFNPNCKNILQDVWKWLDKCLLDEAGDSVWHPWNLKQMKCRVVTEILDLCPITGLNTAWYGALYYACLFYVVSSSEETSFIHLLWSVFQSSLHTITCYNSLRTCVCPSMYCLYTPEL